MTAACTSLPHNRVHFEHLVKVPVLVLDAEVEFEKDTKVQDNLITKVCLPPIISDRFLAGFFCALPKLRVCIKVYAKWINVLAFFLLLCMLTPHKQHIEYIFPPWSRWKIFSEYYKWHHDTRSTRIILYGPFLEDEDLWMFDQEADINVLCSRRLSSLMQVSVHSQSRCGWL